MPPMLSESSHPSPSTCDPAGAVRRSTPLLVIAALLALLAPALASARDVPGPATGLTPSGRQLDPAGRLTTLGAFPTGGALTPDGRFYWAVDAGRGTNAVRIVDVGTGAVEQTLPIPGGYVGVAFAPDGRRAYVSGEPAEGPQPPDARGTAGDVIHVYDVDPASGTAAELDPIAIPDSTRDGNAARDELPAASGVNAWPEGLAVAPDGRHLVVALGQADQAAIVDLASGAVTLADVGAYPYGVAIDPHRPRAYVSNERDGTVSVISIPDGATIATIPVGGGPSLAGYAHSEGLAVDPVRDRLYVAVTDRDLVSVIDTSTLALNTTIPVGRPEAASGSSPINVGVAPDGDRLYVANAGEDAIAVIGLDRRAPGQAPGGSGAAGSGAPGKFFKHRSVQQIGQYRKRLERAVRARERRVARGSRKQAKQAKRKFRRRVRKLKRKRLHGTPVKACGGPSRSQDRRYGKQVLRAFDRRARARSRAHDIESRKRRKALLLKAKRRFRRAVLAAERRSPDLVGCASGDSGSSPDQTTTLGRIPTAAYPTDVEVTPDGSRLVWLAAKGLGTGANPGDESIKELLRGRAGVLDTPGDSELAALTARADREIVPTNSQAPPPGTPLAGPGGGPSDQIKHVFYIVRENRTYDQIFGSDPRGEGDPSLELFDDNGVAGPAGGITPNAHALSRRFSLLDNVYADSEESTAGHKITAGGYANDYIQRYSFTSRGRKGNPDIFPIGTPPGGYIFDQAVRQNVGFRVYGEFGAGNQPFADEGRPTYPAVQANTDPSYPSQVQGTCRSAIPYPPGTPNSVRCTTDAGTVGATSGAPAAQSRVRAFQTQFQAQLAAGAVPAFNYAILFNDHTDGTSPGVYTPRVDLADNDLGAGPDGRADLAVADLAGLGDLRGRGRFPGRRRPRRRAPDAGVRDLALRQAGRAGDLDPLRPLLVPAHDRVDPRAQPAVDQRRARDAALRRFHLGLGDARRRRHPLHGDPARGLADRGQSARGRERAAQRRAALRRRRPGPAADLRPDPLAVDLRCGLRATGAGAGLLAAGARAGRSARCGATATAATCVATCGRRARAGRRRRCHLRGRGTARRPAPAASS